MSRIVALVDISDALDSKRAYKKAWSREEIQEFIMGEKGRKFDPEIVDVFFENIEEVYDIVNSN